LSDTPRPDGIDGISRDWLVYAGGESVHFDAWDRVGEVVRGDDSVTAWDLVRRIVELAPDDRLETVGAGPLEELVSLRGAALVGEIERLARDDARFRRALSAVWLAPGELPPEVERRIVAAGEGVVVMENEDRLPHEDAGSEDDEAP
jgi:hypothetical protein